MNARRFAMVLAASLAASPAAIAAAPPAPGNEVRIVVEGVPDARGQVLAALCARPEFLHATCAWHGRAPSASASSGRVVVVLRGVPPGVYAAQAFQDADGNGRVTRNLFGMPREPMGFSNDAPMRFGPPGFDAASVQIGPEGGTVPVRLHRY